MKNYWKILFLKYFDFNKNHKIDYWEMIIVIFFIIFFQLVIQVGGEYIYDKMFNKTEVIIHYEKNQSDTTIKK